MGNFLHRRVSILFCIVAFPAISNAIDTMTFRWTDARASGPAQYYRVFYHTSKNVVTGQPSGNWNTLQLSPGQSYDIVLSGQTGAQFYHGAAVATGGTPPLEWQSSPVGVGASPYNLDIGADPEPILCSATVDVVNENLFPIVVEWYQYNPPVGGLPASEQFLISKVAQPGQTVTYTLESVSIAGDCSDTPELRAYQLGRELDENFNYEDTTNLVASEDTSLTNTVIIVNSDHLPDWTIDASDISGQGPIDWTGTSTEIQAIQGGFSSSLQYQSQNDVVQNALLSAIRSNTANLNPDIPELSEMQTAAQAAEAYASDFEDASDAVTLTTGFSGSIPDLTVNVGGTVVNLNPFAIPEIATFAGAVRLFITWLSSVVFALGMVRELKIYIGIAVLAPQSSAASSAPIVSSVSALAMAAAVVTIVGSALVVLLTYIVTSAGFLAAMTSPFGGGVLGNAAAFFDVICPIQHLLGLIVAWFVFQFTAGGIAAVAAMSVRFFVGCFFFGLFIAQGEASPVNIANLTGTNITFGSYVIPPGNVVLDTDPGSYSVVGPSGSGTSVVPTSMLTQTDVVVGDTGSSLILSTRTVEFLEPFWLGGVSALTVFGFGYAIRLLKRTTSAGD